MKLTDTVYNVLKWMIVIVLPAVGTLYAALSAVWGWPYSEEVVTSITAVDTFLGAVLCISTASYRADSKNTTATDTKKEG